MSNKKLLNEDTLTGKETGLKAQICKSQERDLTNQVITGIDNIEVWIKMLSGKRVGLVTNPTGISRSLKSTIDILKENSNLIRLYSPEHGVRGDRQAGEKVGEYIDERSGVPVYSLYGKNKKPPRDYLNDVDIIAFDIQDVGSRLYTYISTMSYCMQSCAENGKTFLVFDRPNPLGGEIVEGNLIKEGFASFIGPHPIPYRYGLTAGELALLFQKEFGINCNLIVVPMKGWKRCMYYEDTGLLWVSPSPNMPTVDTAFVYNGTCLFEGTNISEGRGTTKPFELIGAPWLPAYELAALMNEKNLNGVLFRPVYFTPAFSKHAGDLCRGIQLHVTDRQRFQSVKTGLHLLDTVMKLSGKEFAFTESYSDKGKPMIDYNTGSDVIRTRKFNPDIVYQEWSCEAQEFSAKKKTYHLY